VLGRFVTWHGSYEFSRLLAMSLELKMPMDQGIQFAAASMETRCMADEAIDLVQAIRRGCPLSDTLGRSVTFPPTLAYWARCGEQTNDLPGSLRAASELCAQRSANRLLWLRAVAPHAAAVVVIVASSMVMVGITRSLITVMQFFDMFA